MEQRVAAPASARQGSVIGEIALDDLGVQAGDIAPIRAGTHERAQRDSLGEQPARDG